MFRRPESKPEKTFWITNISNRNVTVSDLAISIPAMSSVNLLDKKHYHLTEEQLIASATSGSILKKKHFLAVRRVPPQMIPKEQITKDPNSIIPSRSTSTYEIKQQTYEELSIGDETIFDNTSSTDSSTKGK